MPREEEHQTIETFIHRQLVPWTGMDLSDVTIPDEMPGGEGRVDRRFRFNASWFVLEHTTIHQKFSEREDQYAVHGFLRPIAGRLEASGSLHDGSYSLIGDAGIRVPRAERGPKQQRLLRRLLSVAPGLQVDEEVEASDGDVRVRLRRDDDLPGVQVFHQRLVSRPGSDAQAEADRLISRKASKLGRASADHRILLAQSEPWTWDSVVHTLHRVPLHVDSIFVVKRLATLQQAVCLRWKGRVMAGRFGVRIPSGRLGGTESTRD